MEAARRSSRRWLPLPRQLAPRCQKPEFPRGSSRLFRVSHRRPRWFRNRARRVRETIPRARSAPARGGASPCRSRCSWTHRLDRLAGGVGQAFGRGDFEPGVAQDLFPQLDVGSLQTHHDRNRQAHLGDRRDDALGDDVAPHDAAEDVDEDGLDVLVRENDAEGVLDLLFVGASADVQEIRRFAAGELDQVHGRHGQTCAVDHAADVAVELDVVQTELGRLDFQRVLLREITHRLDVGMAEHRVVVERHLGVERQDLAGLRHQERIDFCQRSVGLDIGAKERRHERDALLEALPGQTQREGELARLKREHAERRIERLADDRGGILGSDFLDLHPPELRDHHRGKPSRPVEGNSQIELPIDVQSLFDQDFLYPLAGGTGLDGHEIHPEDRLGESLRFIGILGQLDAAALAAASGMNLRLDDGAPPETLGDLAGFGGIVGHFAARHGHAVARQDRLGLVFVDLHGRPKVSASRIGRPEGEPFLSDGVERMGRHRGGVRMRRFTLALVLQIAWVTLPKAWALSQPLPDQEVANRIQAYLEPFGETGNLSGSVLVARGGRILFQKSYGMANYELLVSNSSKTRYHIASVSKPFLATAILQLQEQGRLEVTDPVSRYVRDFPKADRITLANLLEHTSGIPNINDLDDYDTFARSPHMLEQLVGKFAGLPLEFEPGSDTRYSNSNYNLLALILEKVTGVSYEKYLHDHIFGPAGMLDSGADSDASRLIPFAASGYAPAGIAANVKAPYLDWSNKTGNGSLYSTVDDLYRFDRALNTETLLKSATRQKYFVEGPDNFLGGEIFQRVGPRPKAAKG